MGGPYIRQWRVGRYLKKFMQERGEAKFLHDIFLKSIMQSKLAGMQRSCRAADCLQSNVIFLRTLLSLEKESNSTNSFLLNCQGLDLYVVNYVVNGIFNI